VVLTRTALHQVPTPLSAALLVLCGASGLTPSRADETSAAPTVVLSVRQETSGQPGQPADGSEARPFLSLRAALAAAPDGALVRIEAGIYREPLVITRSIVLMGKGAGRTRIVGDPAGTAVEVRGAERVQLHGLSIEGGSTCLAFTGGTHRLQNVELRGCTQAGLLGRGASIQMLSSAISDVNGGRDGRGIDLDGGVLEARLVSLQAAGRRGMVLHAARGLLEDVEVRESSLSALQVTDGAEARVVRGSYQGRGGATLYAGGSRLSVEDVQIRKGEYAVLGFRGAELEVRGGELTDYAVAGVAMVNSHGSVERVTIARGGTEAAVSITRADGKKPVLLLDNRISRPGTMGVHVTESAVTARGNSITGARLDAEKDMGDAVYAVDSRLVIEGNVMRGNAGSGMVAVRSQVRLNDNGFIENGRAGLLMLDGSRGSATGNTFQRNFKAGVEVAEQSSAILTQNRFWGDGPLDIDVGCGKGSAGTVEIGSGNLALAGQLRERSCR